MDPELSEEVVARILAGPMFSDLDASAFPRSVALADVVRNDARMRRCLPGEVVVREGDYGNSAFVILSGGVRVILPPGLPPEALGRRSRSHSGLGTSLGRFFGKPRAAVRNAERPHMAVTRAIGNAFLTLLDNHEEIPQNYPTVVLASGQIFGEIAVLGRSPRNATVYAEETTELVEIRWQGLRDIRRRDPAFRRRVDKLYQDRALESLLRLIPYLCDMDTRILAAGAVFYTHGDPPAGTPPHDGNRHGPEVKEMVVKEGDPMQALFLVLGGIASQERRYNLGEETIGFVGRHNLLGLHTFLAAEATGQSPVWNYCLLVQDYLDLVHLPLDVVRAARKAKSVSRQQQGPPMSYTEGVQPLADGLLDFLIDNRLVNGTSTLLIDIDRCVYCNDCLRACAAAHQGLPRLQLRGLRYHSLMVGTSCLHCADPFCLAGCPTGSLHRDPVSGTTQINAASCIGCGVCVRSCPYGYIRLDEAVGGTTNDGKNGIRAAVPKAIKCDQCINRRGGPVCQTACPHDALTRLSTRDLRSLQHWLAP